MDKLFMMVAGGAFFCLMIIVGCAVHHVPAKSAKQVIDKSSRDVSVKIDQGGLLAHKQKAGTTKIVAVVGNLAPHFTLKDEQGCERSLEEFKGKRVVLYFYPKDGTPGCKKQACSLRDSYGLFEKNGIVVLGISYDSVASHQKFKEKYKLPFILLSDSTKKVAKAYGASSAWFFVSQRKTFLINEKGVIIAIINDVDPSTHTALVLERFGIH